CSCGTYDSPIGLTNPRGCNEKRRVPAVHGAREWRWRESNPRPTVLPQDFSGCSLLTDFLGPSDHADKSLTGPVTLEVQTAQVTRTACSGSLDDARNRVESVPGLTDFYARSGGEGEVGAVVISTYWFARSVNEMTLHSRPASPETTTVVETDHPPVELYGPGGPSPLPV